MVCFSLNFQLFCTIVQLLNSDWPANILADAHFRAQENGLSPMVFALFMRAWLGTRLLPRVRLKPKERGCITIACVIANLPHSVSRVCCSAQRLFMNLHVMTCECSINHILVMSILIV